MRRYDDLTLEEKGTAIEKCLGQLLKDFGSGALRMSDEQNANNAQAVIDKILEEAVQQQDMRLAVGWMMEAEFQTADGKTQRLADELNAMAKAEASSGWYPDPTDRILYLGG